MPTVHVKRWSGRLGNNCIQLSNAVYLAQELGIRHVKHPPHKLFRNQIIDTGAEFGSHPGLSGRFFYGKSLLQHAPAMSVHRRKRIFLETLRPEIVLRKPAGPQMESLVRDDSTLVIHVRSGDVFGPNPHPGYVQPPLWYYRTIIENRAWKSILLVCQDSLNPVINRLCADYPIIRINSSTLDTDFSILCSARNLVGSHGTFTHAAFYFSSNIGRYWIPGSMKRAAADFALAFPEQVSVVKCPGYIKVGEWMNSPEQRNIMLKYQPTT